MSPQNLLNSALQHASDGWRVFPCDPKTKRPITDHGFKDATTDELQIRRWWARNPTAMIGAEPPGVVIDVDPRNGGTETAIALEEKYQIGKWNDTLSVLTPRLGVHFHYQFHPDVPQGSNVLGPGIDTRIVGKGYIILPPSVTDDRRTYKWYNHGADILPVPEWVLEVVA